MKVVCAWCQKSLPDKAPLEDQSVSHGICPTCAKAFEKKIKQNSGSGWVLIVGSRVQPKVYERLVDWVVYQVIQKEARSWRLLQGSSRSSEKFSVGTFVELDAAKVRADEEVKFILKDNPGARWHGVKELEADQQDRHAKKKGQKDFFHGKSVAHLESGLAARALKMNPLAVFTVGNPRRGRRKVARSVSRRRVSKNPPKRLNVGIAGVVYNRALEIRAEKTVYQPGLYKHPFDPKSQVEVLALDNGDLLLHSVVGVRLWGKAE